MKSAKIIIENLKEAGVEQAEVVCMKLVGALEKSLPEIAMDAEATSVEKGAAAVLSTVLPAIKPHIEKLVDFDKDGQVG